MVFLWRPKGWSDSQANWLFFTRKHFDFSTVHLFFQVEKGRSTNWLAQTPTRKGWFIGQREDRAYAAWWQELVRQCPLALFPVLQSSVGPRNKVKSCWWGFQVVWDLFKSFVATLRAVNAISKARKDRMLLLLCEGASNEQQAQVCIREWSTGWTSTGRSLSNNADAGGSHRRAAWHLEWTACRNWRSCDIRIRSSRIGGSSLGACRPKTLGWERFEFSEFYMPWGFPTLERNEARPYCEHCVGHWHPHTRWCHVFAPGGCQSSYYPHVSGDLHRLHVKPLGPSSFQSF